MRKILTERHRNIQKTGETERDGDRDKGAETERRESKKREREKGIYTERKKLSHNVLAVLTVLSVCSTKMWP